MKKLLLLVSAFLLCASAPAQGIRRDDIVLDANGHPVPGASVRVCSYPLTGTGPCTPLVTIYQDYALTNPWPLNIASADQFGNSYFFIPNPGPGVVFQLEFSSPGLQTKILDHVTIASNSINTTTLLFNYAVETFSPTPVFNLTTNNAWTMTFTGNVTSSSFSGTPTTGQLVYFNFCQDGIGGRTFVPPTGFVAPTGFVYIYPTANTCTNSSWFYTGSQWILFSAYPLTNSSTTNACNGSSNMVFDVTCYGAVGGAFQVNDGLMTGGSNVLQSGTASFTSGMVGRTAYVQGAVSSTLPLLTTISSFIDSSHVVLSTAATVSTSSAQVMIGIDITSSVQAAVTAAAQGTFLGAAAHGGRIFFPPGQYLIVGPVYNCFDTSSCSGVGAGIVTGSNVDKIVFEGAGFNTTTIYTPGNNAAFVSGSTVAPSDPNHLAGPGWINMSFIGGDQPNGYAIHAGDLTNMFFDGLYLQYYRGASGGLGNGGTGAAIWLDNQHHWSERVFIGDVSISSNCASQACTALAFTQNGGTNSFAYMKVLGLHADAGWISMSGGASVYHGFFRFSGNSLNILVNGSSFENNQLFITAETSGTAGFKVENGGIMENTGTINYANMAAPVILDTSKYALVVTGLNDQACGLDSFGTFAVGETCTVATAMLNPADGQPGPGLLVPAVFAMQGNTAGSSGNALFMFNTVNDGRAGVRVLAGTAFNTAATRILLDPQGLVYAGSIGFTGNAIPTTSGYTNQNGSYFFGSVAYTGKRLVTWPDANVHLEGNNGAGGFVGYLSGATTSGDCAQLNATGTNVASIVDSGAPCGGTGVHHIQLDYADCYNSVASSGWSGPASNFAVANCVTDATNGTVQGALSYADGQFVFKTTNLPADWTAFTDARLSVTTTDTTNGHTIVFALATACAAAGSADTPAYNANQNFTTITIGAGAVSGQIYQTSISTVTGTGCAAGSILHVRLTRGTDTDTDGGINTAGGSLLINYH